MKFVNLSFRNQIAQMLLYIFIVANFLPNELRNITFLLLILLAILTLNRKDYSVNRLELKTLLSYVYMFLITFFFLIYHKSDISYFDNYSRFLLVLPLFFLFRNSLIDKNIFMNILIVVALLIFFNSIYLYYYVRPENIERISGFSSVSITYGNMIMTIVIYLIVSLFEKNIAKKKVIIALALILGIIAWSFTLTKGSLIGLFIVLGYIFLSNTFAISRKIVFAFISSLIILVLLSPAQLSLSRFSSDLSKFSNLKIEQVYKHPEISFSTKERVFLFINAKDIISENPFTGIGYQNFKQHIIEQTQKVDRKYGMAHHDHAHNDFIDIWAKIGILGFLFMIYFFISNIKYFYIALARNKDNYFAKIGMVTMLSQFGFMLTQTQLEHHQATLFFLVLLIVSISQTMKIKN